MIQHWNVFRCCFIACCHILWITHSLHSHDKKKISLTEQPHVGYLLLPPLLPWQLFNRIALHKLATKLCCCSNSMFSSDGQGVEEQLAAAAWLPYCTVAAAAVDDLIPARHIWRWHKHTGVIAHLKAGERGRLHGAPGRLPARSLSWARPAEVFSPWLRAL